MFGPREATLSAELYRSLKRARGPELDMAIAACAMVRDADLWTLNVADFRDIPQLQLAAFSPPPALTIPLRATCYEATGLQCPLPGNSK